MSPSPFDRLLAGLPRPLEATLRMYGAGASDVAHALDVLGVMNGAGSADPLAARDPDYIGQTLPALRLLSDVYFRGEVRGLENIPTAGPVLLVGNHSGGTLIADTFVFAQAFYDHFGPQRRFHQLAHDLVFKVPGPRAMLARYGTVPASAQNMRRAVGRGAALLVYPGGDHETAGSRARSTSPVVPASSSSRWRQEPRSSRSPRSAARRPRCFSVRAAGWPSACSWTACCA